MTEPLITMIVPYYRQPNMLRKQYDTWGAYSDAAKAAFKFIVVDDCSPEPAEPIVAWSDFLHNDLQMALYRIDKQTNKLESIAFGPWRSEAEALIESWRNSALAG